MNIKISILVPVYNVEKYLPRCIESVLSQDFTDYELILVDDGSSDKCADICDEYSKKYPRIIKVLHKENGGLPSARLAGFQHASGKYIMFLDSDDYLFPNALSFLYDKIEEGYDIVKGVNKIEYQEGRNYIERHKVFDEEIIGADNYISRLIRYEIAPYLWGGLYRKEVISERDFKPVLDFSIGEDWLLNISIGRKINKMLCVDNVVYCYSINYNSIMKSKIPSYDYWNRLNERLGIVLKGCRPQIMTLIEVNRIVKNIKCFFTPELNFNVIIYNEIRKKINDQKYNDYIKKNVDKKYLFLLNYRFLYYIYTRLFCFLYKYVRLKGLTRKVIY